jgi:16S rRNA (guanine527-N7)-methyltransferase
LTAISGRETESEAQRAHLPYLVDGIREFGLQQLTAEQVALFSHYQELLLTWNRRMNLTAITDPAGIQVRHFLDSLTCALVTGPLAGHSLADVGTGAGFPGVALKIYFPDLRLTVVESVAKKTHFLRSVVAELGLTNVTVINERAEVLGHDSDHRERYDWVVARAVAEMRVLVEYLLPLCRLGGHVLAQKGIGVAAETAAAVSAIDTMGGALPQVRPVQLPGVDGLRHLVMVEKIAKTPPQYPRRAGIPSKRPFS